MRSRRFYVSISVLFLSLLLAAPAFAHTVSLTFQGGTGNVYPKLTRFAYFNSGKIN